MKSPTIEDLLKQTEASEIKAMIVKFGMEDFCKAISTRLNRPGVKSINEAEKIYTLVAIYAYKNKQNKQGETVAEQLLGKLEETVANRLDSYKVNAVHWYFEHIGLERIDSILSKTKNVRNNKKAHNLILSTLKKRLADVGTQSKDKLVLKNTRDFLLDILKYRTRQTNDENTTDTALQVYQLLADNANKFEKNDDCETVADELLSRSAQIVADKLCGNSDNLVDDVRWYFDNCNLAQLEIVFNWAKHPRDLSLELIVDTFNKLLEATVPSSGLVLTRLRNNFHETLQKKLKSSSDEENAFAKRIYEVFAKHVDKFAKNDDGKTVVEELLSQVETTVLNRLESTYGTSIEHLSWYLEAIGLERLDTILGKVRRAQPSDVSQVLILSTLEKRLAAVDSKGELDLPNTREFLLKALDSRLGRTGDENIKQGKRIYNVLADHADKFIKTKEGKTVAMQLLKQLEKKVASKLCNHTERYVGHLSWYFEQVDLARFDAVVGKTEYAYRYDDAHAFIMNTLENRLESVLPGAELNLAKTRDYLFEAIKYQLNNQGDEAIAQAERIYKVLATHVDKFKKTKKGKTVTEDLLSKLESTVASKVNNGHESVVKRVNWYIEVIDLARLDSVIGQTDRAHMFDAAHELILSTLENRLSDVTSEGELELANTRIYLHSAIHLRLNRSGEEEIAQAKRIYEVLASHADKFTKNDDEETVSEQLLGQLEENVAKKLNAGSDSYVGRVVWYFEAIDLARLDTLLGLADDAFYSDTSHALILSTLDKLLKAAAPNSELELVKTRTYLLKAIHLRLNRSGEEEIAQAKRIYEVFASHADKFTKNEDEETVSEQLLGQLEENVAKKLNAVSDSYVERVVWYFEEIDLARLDTLLGLADDAFYSDTSHALILSTLDKLLKAAAPNSELELVKTRTYLLKAIHLRLNRSGEEEIAQAKRIYEVLASHADKFTKNEDEETVSEQLLGQLEENVAKKLNAVSDSYVERVVWYFEAIDLARLDTLLGLADDAFYSDTSHALILSTLDKLLKAAAPNSELELAKTRTYLLKAIQLRLNRSGEEEIAQAKRIYEVLASHADKFTKNEDEETVSEQLLGQLEEDVAKKLSDGSKSKVARVRWYFEAIDLARLESVVSKTKDAYYRDGSKSLIVDTIERLLIEQNINDDLKLPKTREFLVKVMRNELEFRSSKDYAFELPNNIYGLLHNPLFSDVEGQTPQVYCLFEGMIPVVYKDHVLSYVKNLVDQLPEQATKDDCYTQMKEVRIGHLFRHNDSLIDFDEELDMDKAKEAASEFASSFIDKINDISSLSQLQDQDIYNIILASHNYLYHFSWKLRQFINLERFQVIHDALLDPIMEYLSNENYLNKEIQAKVNTWFAKEYTALDDFIKQLIWPLSDKLHANATEEEIVHVKEKMAFIEALIDGTVIGKHVELPEPFVTQHQGTLNGLQLKLNALQGEISEESSSSVSQNDDDGKPKDSTHQKSSESESDSHHDSQNNDHPIPGTVSDSFEYFNQVMVGYQNYLKNVPKDDARHDIFNTFNTHYNDAETDQAKIVAITAVLQNQESRTTLKKETHGERFIHALKVILSVLTLGLGAIAFAAHAKSKYQNGHFGHNSGAMFLKKCDNFVDNMTTVDEDESHSYG